MVLAAACVLDVAVDRAAGPARGGGPVGCVWVVSGGP